MTVWGFGTGNTSDTMVVTTGGEIVKSVGHSTSVREQLGPGGCVRQILLGVVLPVCGSSTSRLNNHRYAWRLIVNDRCYGDPCWFRFGHSVPKSRYGHLLRKLAPSLGHGGISG